MPRAFVARRPGEAERHWFVAPWGVTKTSHEAPLGKAPTASPTWECKQPPARSTGLLGGGPGAEASPCWGGGSLRSPPPSGLALGRGAPRTRAEADARVAEGGGAGPRDQAGRGERSATPCRPELPDQEAPEAKPFTLGAPHAPAVAL